LKQKISVRFGICVGMLLLASNVLLTPAAHAQVDAGGIRGTIADSSGALVSGAKVTLTNEGSGLSIEAITASDGNYSFTPIKIGSYTLVVEAAGFRKATQRGIKVDVQQQLKADFNLEPGSVKEEVFVTAAISLLQTQDASVGTLASRAQINDLPLNGRNYTFLAQLGPGVTGLSATRGLDKTGSFVANGLSSVHNSYILDGIDNNNDTVDFLNGAAYVSLPPPDAIQEFKVQTSNFSAEFGRAGGAVVNATIKSGTNQFHGSAWEFLRNDRLDAIDAYFVDPATVKRPQLQRNQFGFSAGGPIIKNKMFIFGDYEVGRIRQSTLKNPSVPTAAQRSSGYTDFRDVFTEVTGSAQDALNRTIPSAAILDPATTRPVTAGQVDPVTGLLATSTGFVRDPFYTNGSIAGVTDFTTLQSFLNQIPANRLDPNAVKLLDLFPAPTQGGLSNNYAVNRSLPDDSQHFDIRVDNNFSVHDQVFGRVSYSKRDANIPADFTGEADNVSFGQGATKDRSWNLVVSEVHSFSPTLLNEFRFGYSRLRTTFDSAIANQQGIPAKFGIQGIPDTPGNGGLPTLSISGLTSLGPNGFASPNRRQSDTIQFSENLTKTHGAHSFKGGFEYQSLKFPWLDPAWSRGGFSFGGYTGIPNVTPGVATADFLLTPIASTVPNGVNNVGGPNSVFSSNIVEPADRRKYFGAYFQDDWKVTSKLTVNLGLRWEIFGQLQEEDGKQATLVPGSNGSGSEYLILNKQKDVPLSPSFTSLLAQDGIALRYVGGGSVSNTPLADFAPRVGLAYQFTPKLVVRAGYGIFYGGFENLGGSPDPGFNYPFAVNLSIGDTTGRTGPIVYADGNTATLERGLLSFTPDPNSPNFVASSLGTAFQRDTKTPYTQQWNGSVQYAFTPAQSVTVSYVGNGTRHMLNTSKLNQPAELLPPTIADYKPFIAYPHFSPNMDFMTENGDAYYHAAQVAYEHVFSDGLNMLVNYTRSECKTDNRNALGIGEGDLQRAPLLPGFGIKGDYKYCGNDVPNTFHASGVWQLPIGKGHKIAGNVPGIVNQIIGGWSTQAIFTLQDGFPFSVAYDASPFSPFCPVKTDAAQGCYANVVKGQKLYAHTGPHGTTQFLNPAAFANPPVVTTIGQTDYSPLGGPPTQVHGPGFTNLDFSMFKRFRTSETTNLEFRGEFFNFLNHPNFANSFKTLDFVNSPKTFAQINATRGAARQVQLALKFYW
jgi:hypothetical protein